MTANRKRKGDAAEALVSEHYSQVGGVCFPLSPNYPGVDIIWLWHGIVSLLEVKGRKQSANEKAEALEKLLVAVDKVRKSHGFKAIRAELWEKVDDKSGRHWLLTNALTNESTVVR